MLAAMRAGRAVLRRPPFSVASCHDDALGRRRLCTVFQHTVAIMTPSACCTWPPLSNCNLLPRHFALFLPPMAPNFAEFFIAHTHLDADRVFSRLA